MAMTPSQLVAKWTKLKFNAANYDKIDDSYFREFTQDLADTFGIEAVTVPPYVAGFTYSVGNLVRFSQLNGPEGFYYAIKAGKLASPQGNFTDWKVVPGPILPTELSHAMTLSQAQGLDGAGVVPGRTYLINCGPDAQGADQIVNVRGVSNDKFDIEGTLEVDTKRTAITDFNVQAGTWAVKQYGASGASTFAQLGGVPGDNAPLATALAGKADLDANGKVPFAQTQQRYELFLDYPAGQITTSIRRIVLAGMAGSYNISAAQFAQVQSITINGAPAINSSNGYVFAYMDTIAVQASTNAGQAGYVILTQVV